MYFNGETVDNKMTMASRSLMKWYIIKRKWNLRGIIFIIATVYFWLIGYVVVMGQCIML